METWGSLHLLATVDEALLDGRDALLLLDFFLDLGDLRTQPGQSIAHDEARIRR